MTEPLVLLPGFMCDSRLFEAQIAALGRDYVVATAPVWSAERIEETASALLDQLPSRFALCGHSFGGMVALEIVRRAPKRVTRLCLISTTPLTESPEFAATREPRIVAARSGRMADVMTQEVPLAALAPGVGRAAAHSRLIEMAEDLGAEAHYRQTRALQRRRDQQDTMRGITQPLLLMCGFHDTIYPVKRHEFMAELLPYSELKIIDGAGHLAPLEAPDAVTDALSDWMRTPLMLR